ncbi:MAG TPA: type I polyketide synthase, partial [Tahibacter sp.]|nr:type I polyketide synthase [Tahibacter sp.]
SQGRDCIGEIPAERWDVEAYFQPDREREAGGTYYAKWGGFVDGFADFDPLFFGIAPREAADMDPQERLFVESCWTTLEDAGYTRELLATRHARKVGVFAGITKTGFELHAPLLWAQGEAAFPRTSFGSLANRVSYLLNLSGPSMPVDTMCSASLTAIHEACEHLLRGECELALAGGVNLYLHPANYIALCAQRMLAADGRCKSFGAGGDGFVPGEGVGTVLLKPLSLAERDGDTIHALIRGTSINHGGKTNGYTVPSPVAQAELIRAALDKAGVNARHVSYIEAHGTGTALGDPIEISGLTQAFAADTSDRQFCAIGSVKTNIGHLESAAGIAGVTKLVLQLRHGQLAPSLHASELNPNIDFATTPFTVQRELSPWTRPVVDGREMPRIAGISSFGAGGSNAHVIVEEYRAAPDEGALQGPALIVLSARHADRLQAQAERLLAALRSGRYAQTDLAAIAWTLQSGREAMDERLALVATTLDEAIAKLAAFTAGRGGEVEGLYRGKRNKEALSVFDADADLQRVAAGWIGKGQYGRLLDLWVKGLGVDWRALYTTLPRRIGLPGYAFARERYWLPPIKPLATTAVQAATLHPLLHRNVSDLAEQRYSSTFTGSEFFLADHVIGGHRVLPGVAYLEMARAAVAQATGSDAPLTLSQVVWLRPLAVDAPTEVGIALAPQDDGGIAFEIRSGDTVHAQGIARPAASVPAT